MAIEMHQARDSQGFPALQGDVRDAGDVAGSVRRDIERRGQPEHYKSLTVPATQPTLPLADAPDYTDE